MRTHLGGDWETCMSKGGREVRDQDGLGTLVSWNLNPPAPSIALIGFSRCTDVLFSHCLFPYDGEMFIVSYLTASANGEKTGISLPNSALVNPRRRPPWPVLRQWITLGQLPWIAGINA